MRVPYSDFSGGLWVADARDKTPAAAFRRLKGVHPVRADTVRSRDGSTQLYALTAHSLAKLGSARFQGVGTALYRNGGSILTGLDGTRLAFAKMPPSLTAELGEDGKGDYLFVAGGGLLKKVDESGNVTKWGIEKPVTGFTAVADAQVSTQIDPLDTAGGWTGVAAALADEGTIKQEGTNSMKMTVAKSATGTATKAIAIDLEVDYPENAYISVWVRIDDPSHIDQLLIQFDVAGGTFAVDTYSYTVLAASTVQTADNPDPTLATWVFHRLTGYAAPTPPPPDGPIHVATGGVV